MANWLWYPGDFEIYHGMCQNFEREERGFFWPAYWKVDDCRHNVKFSAVYQIKKETRFTARSVGQGHICLRWKEETFPDGTRRPFPFAEKKCAFGEEVICPAREVSIEAIIANRAGLPSLYVERDEIFTDSSWKVTDLASEPLPAGLNTMYVRQDQNPMDFEYSVVRSEPRSVEKVNGGNLYDFGRELTASTVVFFSDKPVPLTLCYGESRPEALDVERCYLKHRILGKEKDIIFGSFEQESLYRTKLRAFRYIYIPEGEVAEKVRLSADHTFVDFARRGKFLSQDEQLNRIWDVAEETFRLASGIFFVDGIKRDRWIWSGDAYQSYFINQYLFFDREICKRTILALRGNDPVVQHLNTIVDYSLYWIISLENYYLMTGDLDFIRMIYPKMESLMGYCMEQLDEHGFIYGRPGDWIYIDWADIDKEGTTCAEQMLLARSYQAVAAVRKLLGMDETGFELRFTELMDNIRNFFWDDEKGAFIDSYCSGKRTVSRHANIFAILFEYASAHETRCIIDNVLFNTKVPAITTPYFKFYELEVLLKLGHYSEVLEMIKAYWGGMLDQGAATFWEEYKPGEPKEKQYGMYGDPYGKSLCHAWGASPIYLIGRYFMGVRATKAAYETFEAAPATAVLTSFECEFPVNEGFIKMRSDGRRLTVYTNKDGGTLLLSGKYYSLTKDFELEVILNT